MRFLPLVFLSACAFAGEGQAPEITEELRDPERVFPAFQKLVRMGHYGSAYDTCLSPDSRRALSYEEFYISLSSFEPVRRLVASARVHGLDSEKGRFRLCSPDFDLSCDLGLHPLTVGKNTFYQIDLNRGDVGQIRSRALEWHRHQVRRADGWHFAYPPDWDYAPLAHTCPCRRTT